ncbi:MAG: beta-ketoacyl synthase N-terminal-like domain-containing protein [Candidatus Riflebacteria bacterium]|nr:beta-ketoacyl synthase N-terminal-like domain-containing protein [Candidatus Riflebacteria bacterium]
MTVNKHKSPYSIAITGIGGIFPGSSNLEEFWQMIDEGRSAVGRVNDGRWPESGENYQGVGYEPDKVKTVNCCSIKELRENYEGLNVTPEFMSNLDPLYKIALLAGRDAFYDAKTENLDRTRVQVIIANIALPTDSTSAITRKLNMEIIKSKLDGKQVSTESLFDDNPLNRLSAELPAGLIAATLGLGGGCYTLDAACASSLYAIKRACDELTAGRADAVLSGGLSRPSCQFTQMGFTQLHAISASGICRPFDKDGDGLIVGEGGGLFLLKRLEDAINCGDKIYGIIRGIGLANDIGGSLLAPYTEGQLRAMRDAYAQAGWQPTEVQLIECHGTGTPTGDAVELKSIKELMGTIYPEDYECVIGSVKSNVGHLLTGAGAAGLMKLILALKNSKLPGVANFRSADPALELDKTPIRILTESRVWERPFEGISRKCALSAFGFGGIDGHVLLEEYLPSAHSLTAGHPVLRRNRPKPLLTGMPDIKAGSNTNELPEVAVVALDTFVGSLKNSKDFFKAILNCEPAKKPVPENRHRCAIDNVEFKEGAYIDKLEIRAGEFKISPLELTEVLPQQLLMLKTVSGAMSEMTSDIQKEKMDWGTFIGISQDFDASNFASRWAIKADSAKYNITEIDSAELADAISAPLNHPRTVGALGGIVASRIAREYGIGGPSHTFSSSENSGLSALEAAVRSLQNNEISTAIVGAVDMAGDLRHLLATDKLRPYSRIGGSVPFNKGSDGAFPGEGAVALILKRKDDALKDGDRILSIIKGIGKASCDSLDSKDSKINACMRAMDNAWKESGLVPAKVRLFEASASGSAFEDEIEAEAMSRYMPVRDIRKEDLFQNDSQLCAISATKAVIGQTGAAAGLFSLAKAVLCLNRQLLPSYKTLTNPIEPLAKRQDFFFTPNSAQYWFRNRVEGPRVASVNSIGLDGSYYHAVLEEFEKDELLTQKAKNADSFDCSFPAGEPEECVFAIGGTATCDLKERISALRNLEASSIQQLAREYAQQFPLRDYAKVFAGIVASSIGELREKIDLAVSHIYNTPDKPILFGPENGDKVFYNPKPNAVNGKVVFAFPGSGNHFLSMGTELGVTWSEHLKKLDKNYELVASQFAPRKIAPWRLAYGENYEEEAMGSLIADHNSLVFSHVSCCAFLSDVVRSFGIEPQIIMGYSLGETAGNFATGTWRERDEMVRRMRNSNLFTTELIGEYNAPRKHWGLDQNAKIEWALGVIACPASEVEKYIADYDQVYILIENTPEECVIGGNRAQLDVLVNIINKPFFALDGVSSVHCPAAIPASEAYRNLHLYDCYPPEGMSFISSGKGDVFVPEREASADSILAQCIGKIDFPKCVETAYSEGGRVFLEMGPQGSMTRMINKILGDRPHFARAIMPKNRNQNSSLVRFLANCVAEGIKVNLEPLYAVPEKASVNSTRSKLKPIEVPTCHPIIVPTPKKQEAIIEMPKPVVEAPKVEPAKKVSADLPKSVPQPMPKPQTMTQQKSQSPIKPQVVPQYQSQSMPQQQSQTLPKSMPKTLPTPPKSEPVVTKPVYVSKTEENTFKESSMNNIAPNTSNSVVASWYESQKSLADAHNAYLNFSNSTTELIGKIIAGEAFVPANVVINKSEPTKPALRYPKAYTGEIFLDRKGSMEFAVGKIGNALGDYFASIDAHPTRVRLPDIPLNFVDRIITVEGEKGSLKQGRVVTEHDVYPETWYLDNECMPTGLAVEAGQADLFLSAWLGIDFKTKGIAKYRLLDAVVTFHGPLPRPGDTIHYDIRVDRFIRQADTYLFFFEYDGSIDGKHLITMRNGCAGFFTDKQLADGKGIVLTEDDLRPSPQPDLPGRENLPVMVKQSFDDDALELLRQSRFEEAFGSDFAGLNINAQTIPSGDLKMIDRITEIDPKGGRFGLGRIKAEIDIPQNAWFLTQHFCDDQVMPGTLMYESCMQSLRVFLLRMGWIAPAETSAFEPIIGVQSQLRCRGQVIPGVKKALYDIEIKELGYGPEPYAIADALMFADGNRIVQVLNMSIRLSGTNRAEIEQLWKSRINCVCTPTIVKQSNSEVLPALYTSEQIREYAIGKPSLCFGPEFKAYDNDKFLARLPNPPFLFVDRITKVNAEYLKIQTDGTVQGQFDIKPDHWFFRANRQSSIPFAVMLEFPLQVCGWYSCYMGSANTSNKPLHYRNLDGSAILYEDVNLNSGTLTATVKSTKAASSAGMLIQSFDLLVTQGNRKIYEGETTFGFFSEEALANQIGLRGVNRYTPTEAEKARSFHFELPNQAPFTPSDNTEINVNGLTLPGKALLMVDNIELFIPDGGPKGLGYIRGTKTVDKNEWFFKAHFYQDPVIPGSLGLESFIQLMKIAAINRWGAELRDTECHFEPIAVGNKHKWSYRGQVIPTDKLVTVDACITAIDDASKTMIADGFLSVDGRIIYSMKDFGLRVAVGGIA